MRKASKILSIIIPIVLVIVLAVSLIPIAFADDNNILPTSVILDEYLDGQIQFGTSDSGAMTSAKEYKGGAIFVEPYTEMDLQGGTFSGHNNTYGGAIYVCEGATLHLGGCSFIGNTAEYGGAIYVESNAVLFLDACTFAQNKALYGGAIYVEAGGIVKFPSDGRQLTIVENSAGYGPAIFLEDGAELLDFEIRDDAYRQIADNTFEYYKYQLKINPLKQTLGTTYYKYGEDYYYSQTKLYTLEYGSYPKTLVDDELSSELESLYAEKSSNIVFTTYNCNNTNQGGPLGSNSIQKWYGYVHTDGNLYVRGRQYATMYSKNTLTSNVSYSFIYGNRKKEVTLSSSNSFFYALWFKVEPIEWYILNYAKWVSGAENIKLLSRDALLRHAITPNTTTARQTPRWENNPEIRTFLNDTFRTDAFSDLERNMINYSEVYNNNPGEYDSINIYNVENFNVDSEEFAAHDYVYLPSAQELSGEPFWHSEESEVLNSVVPERVCVLTDFCIGNGSVDNYVSMGDCKFENEDDQPCIIYWLRSQAGKDMYVNVCIGRSGDFSHSNTPDPLPLVRPMMQLTIKYSTQEF